MGFSLVAGTVCVIFFLIGSVCVNFLSPEPDCAQIFSLHSFCMGFSLVAGTVCVIFFLIGSVCVNFLSPEPDCALFLVWIVLFFSESVQFVSLPRGQNVILLA